MTATPKIPEARKVPELTLHPLCTLIPPCTEEEFKELKEDIKKNGLQVPIKLFEGKILDGRSRHMACVELEKEFYTVDFKAEDFTRTTNDALAYVISMNVKRRHLTASQRAIIAARLVTTTLGGDRSVKLPTEITQENVARLSGVAVKMVTDAKKVLNHSDPELTKKVLNGEVAVAAAAKQVRDKEREAKGKPSRKKNSESPKPAEVYKTKQEELIDALKEFTSVEHAEEWAEKTKERLDQTIAAWEEEEEEHEKAA
jgi:ParB-like chromosome segregation protein Spo0J